MSSLTFVVAALAAYRITMIVVADELTEPIRTRIVGRYVYQLHEQIIRPSAEQAADDRYGLFRGRCRCGVEFEGRDWADVASEINGHTNEANRAGVQMSTGPRWLILLDCAWCASMWIAVPVGWSAWCFGDRGWWFVPASVLAFSAVTGIISTYAKPMSRLR